MNIHRKAAEGSRKKELFGASCSKIKTEVFFVFRGNIPILKTAIESKLFTD